MWPNRKLLALCVAAGLLGGACVSDQSAPETDPRPSQEPESGSPDQIPRAILHATPTERQISGKLVYSSWLVDRSIRRQEDFSGLDSRPAESIETAGREVRISLQAEASPSRVQVAAYRDRDSTNKPVEKFMDVDCRENVPDAPCSYTANRGVTIRAVLANDAEIIALNVGWAIPPEVLNDNRRLPPEVSAAWAFILKA